MQNKVICVNPSCKAELKRPQTPFIKCPSCNTDFFVFCHQFPFKLFEHVQCKKCPNELYYFFCFKCTGLMNFVKYRMGSISSCKCGFNGCYVVCDKCKKPECFPPDRRYQGIAWKCSFCKNPFNFMTCDQCYHSIYQTNFYAGQSLSCKSTNCRANLTVKKCDGCKFIFMDSRGRNRCEPCYEEYKAKGLVVQPPAVSKRQVKDPVKKQTSLPSTPNQNSLCKICLDKEAEYINVKCFHLATCEVCVHSMKNVCPICRAEGQFRKVFK